MRDVYRVDVDRVVVSGRDIRGIDPSDLGSAIVRRLRAALATAPMPQDRLVRGSVDVRMTKAPGRDAIAESVTHGVTTALKGGEK